MLLNNGNYKKNLQSPDKSGSSSFKKEQKFLIKINSCPDDVLDIEKFSNIVQKISGRKNPAERENWWTFIWNTKQSKLVHAQMMELVDMLDSKSGGCKAVWVQVPLWVRREITLSLINESTVQKSVSEGSSFGFFFK